MVISWSFTYQPFLGSPGAARVHGVLGHLSAHAEIAQFNDALIVQQEIHGPWAPVEWRQWSVHMKVHMCIRMSSRR